jgi:hypothetical protein
VGKEAIFGEIKERRAAPYVPQKSPFKKKAAVILEL